MEEGSESFKNINQITQARSPSPKSGRQNINTYNNITSKSTNSKCYTLSSVKKDTNPSKDFQIDSEKKKMLFEDQEECKNYKILATNVRIQNKILEEYQNWTNILLSIINSKKINNAYNDIGTPIQLGLKHIEKLKNENLEVKTLIINKKENNENTEKMLDKKQKTQNMLIKEFNEKDKNKQLNLKKEKEQLSLNVQMLANELDDLNENNKQLYDKIQKDSKLKKIYELYKIRNQLKEENKLYKKIMVFKSRNDYIDLQETLFLSLSQNRTSIPNLERQNIDKINKSSTYMGNREYGSIGHFHGFGDYKLEKEENIISNDNAFFCGF